MDVIALAAERETARLDWSAAVAPLSVKTAWTGVPEKCLFDGPKLCRQLIELVSQSSSVTEMAPGGTAETLLQI